MKTRAIVTVLAVLSACGGNKSDGPSKGEGKAKPLLTSSGDAPDGLDMRVSEGQQGKPAIERAQIASAKQLAANEVTALLARAKPIATEATDVQGFALRAKSQPPPKTGQTIQGQFPPIRRRYFRHRPPTRPRSSRWCACRPRARCRSHRSSRSRSANRWSR
jgi:hypothetical protein